MVGKMVRHQTQISKGAMSHSQATVQVIESHVADLTGIKIMVLGAHNMNGNILHYLRKKGAQNVLISNRKYIKAFQLAQEHQCKAFRFDKIRDYLQEADVVISATSAPHLVIKEEQVTASKKQLMVDLAVPRDIDPALSSRSNIKLFNVEDIENQIGQNMNERLSEIELAQQIIEKEADKFMAWQTKRQQYHGSKKNKNTRAA
jgi:glutamyl-tRNA reductase